MREARDRALLLISLAGRSSCALFCRTDDHSGIAPPDHISAASVHRTSDFTMLPPCEEKANERSSNIVGLGAPVNCGNSHPPPAFGAFAEIDDAFSSPGKDAESDRES